MRFLDRFHNPSLGLLLIRLMLAVVFLYHGSQKLFGVFGGHGLEGMAQVNTKLGIPLPWFSGLLAALAEFGGGLALATGLFLRPMMVPLAFTMFVAVFVAHAADPFAKKEYPLTLALVAIGLFFTGPGRYALGGTREEA